jgi:hypothetical protein
MPILPARGGAFRAISAASPLARSRMVPMFDVRAVALKGGKTLDGYLDERARGIRQCWEIDRPVYIDVHDLPLDLRTGSGMQPITFMVESLRAHGYRAVPVTGTQEDRGADYLGAIRQLVSWNEEGVCLRLDREEITDLGLLRSAVTNTLNAIGLSPNSVDVVLDFRHVGRDKVEVLCASALEAVKVIRDLGNFRNVVVAGSSVPDTLPKRTEGVIVRRARRELEVWKSLLQNWPMPFSDYAVVGAFYSPPKGFVNVPPRIRYTTLSEHVIRRAGRGDYHKICAELVDSDDYLGDTYSIADQKFRLASQGKLKTGNAGIWVAYDTNHHLELVSEQAWTLVHESGQGRHFVLPPVQSKPWLQPELIDA